MNRVIFIVVFVLFLVLNTAQEMLFKRRNIDTKGTPPINKKVFILSKLFMLLTWVSALLQAIGVNLRMIQLPEITNLVSSLSFLMGFLIVALSFYYLGDANTMGLPNKEPSLKDKGFYRFTRNPIYLGFFFMIFGSVLYTQNIIVLLLGVFSIIVHHKIIISEEKHLIEKLGNVYLDYQKKVRRYL